MLFDLPVTATAQLETAMRAKVKQLIPAGYVTDARLADERYQQGAESAAKYALLCTTIVGIDAFVHAAKSGKLRAAAAATGLLQLALRLHGLLTAGCKCYSATSSKAAEEVYVQDEQGLSHLWTGIKSCSELLAALLSSLRFLAMPADTTPVQHRLSGSSLALQLGPGAAPWLHVAGRILLLLAQLLALLPCKGFQIAAPNADHAQKMWSSITDQLKEQLQTLFLPGVIDAAYATVGWVDRYTRTCNGCATACMQSSHCRPVSRCTAHLPWWSRVLSLLYAWELLGWFIYTWLLTHASPQSAVLSEVASCLVITPRGGGHSIP